MFWTLIEVIYSNLGTLSPLTLSHFDSSSVKALSEKALLFLIDTMFPPKFLHSVTFEIKDLELFTHPSSKDFREKAKILEQSETTFKTWLIPLKPSDILTERKKEVLKAVLQGIFEDFSKLEAADKVKWKKTVQHFITKSDEFANTNFQEVS